MAVYGEKEKDKPRSLLYVTEDKEDRGKGTTGDSQRDES